MVDLLIERGFAVRVIDNLVGGREANIAHHADNPDFTFAASDIRDVPAGQRAVRGRRLRVSFRGHRRHRAVDRAPDGVHVGQRAGHRPYARSARAPAGVKKFVYAASSSCYGAGGDADARRPPDRAAIPLRAEQVSGRAGRVPLATGSTGCRSNSIRIFNAYGTRSRTSGAYGAVFGVFLKQKLAGKPFTVVGDGTQTRDFLYVTDVAAAFLRRGRNGQERRGLEPGRRQSAVGQPPGRAARRPGRSHSQASGRAGLHLRRHFGKIRRDLDWAPKVSFEEGVGRILENIEYWRDAPLWEPASIAKET